MFDIAMMVIGTVESFFWARTLISKLHEACNAIPANSNIVIVSIPCHAYFDFILCGHIRVTIMFLIYKLRFKNMNLNFIQMK